MYWQHSIGVCHNNKPFGFLRWLANPASAVDTLFVKTCEARSTTSFMVLPKMTAWRNQSEGRPQLYLPTPNSPSVLNKKRCQSLTCWVGRNN